MCRYLLACCAVGLCLSTPGLAQVPILLTARDAAGVYCPTPQFAGGDTEKATVPFSAGALTDGKVSYDWKIKPTPYCYWQRQGSAELLVDLKRMCHLQKVRVHLLNSGPHGTESVQVFLKGDPLEFPDNLSVGTIKPALGGWNELPVDKLADGLRLAFIAQPGKGYITLSEIEVWGTPAAQSGEPTMVAGDSSPKRVTDGITWWAFDFGPTDSPSFAQFYVADSKCVYSRERGFGWIPYKDGQPMVESNFGPGSQAVPGLAERDRGAKGKSYMDALYRDFVMTSAYYHTQVRQTFALDVPNGTYRVMTMHGDTQYGSQGKQPSWIEAEGKRVATDIVFPASLCTDVVFDATVQDGRLDLTFDADSPDLAARGFVLNGLVVIPTNTAAEVAFADKRVAAVRATAQRDRDDYFARTFHEVPYVETATMVEPTAADSDRGFIAWTPQWMTLLYPNSVPTAEAVQRPLTTFATPGEYEPVVVSLRALKPLRAVSLTVGDLQGPAAGRIPASAWDVRTVKCWPQRKGSSWSTEYQVMPELLEPAAPFDLGKDVTKEFWLTIKVPEDARPGEYRGPVTVQTAEGKQWQTTLSLQVMPFKLDDPERVVGMYWHDTGVGDEVLDKQVRDMVAHGVRAVTISRAPKITGVDGKLVVDTADLRAFLRHLRDLGLQGPIPYRETTFQRQIKAAVPTMDPEEGYVQVITALEQVSSDPTALKLLYYPVDEIGNDDARGKLANHLCGLVAKVSGATSYITVNNYASGEKWGDTFDLWCGNVDYRPDQEQQLLARGKRYMRYGSSYVNDCRMARNNCGLGFLKRPAEAMYFWHYQCPVADPFNDLDADSRDWCAAYPGPEGTPIPTMDWESHREGIDDLRYVATLKQLAARAEKGTAVQKQAATRALVELAAVLNTDDSITQTRWAERLTHDEYNTLRWRLAQAIVALQETLP
ncbi:DUF4091 domain-containing protein [bacterium]|nr:DUF4091 domain-containing protein [bacterium]